MVLPFAYCALFTAVFLRAVIESDICHLEWCKLEVGCGEIMCSMTFMLSLGCVFGPIEHFVRAVSEACVGSIARLWADIQYGTQFVCIPIVHCRRDVSLANSYVDSRSRLLSAVSGNATKICCGGLEADFIEALNRSLARKAGVQYPFTLPLVKFERLLHEPSFSVKGRIEIFFLLWNLSLRLSVLLDERWVQSTQFIRRVSIGNIVLLFPGFYSLSMNF